MPQHKNTSADFWARVHKTAACWEWQGYRMEGKRPYGKTRYDGKRQYAHRIAWGLTYGPIPAGLLVLHTCDNPPCCNPAHLFLGTHRDNIHDALNKGRLEGRVGGKGETHGNAKLTWPLVHTIRQQHAQGVSIRAIAANLGIAWNTAYRVVIRQTWKQQ